MRWKSRNPLGRFTLRESVEIDADAECVFSHWIRYEDFPRFTQSVRRTKRIDERRVLWDADIAGRQVVWEARIRESVPGKLVRWESSWGAHNSGEVCLERLPGARTRLNVRIEFRPEKALEQLGARLGLVDLSVGRDLDRFRAFVEAVRRESHEATPESIVATRLARREAARQLARSSRGVSAGRDRLSAESDGAS